MAVILARLSAVVRSADAPAAVDSTSSLLGPKRILAVMKDGQFAKMPEIESSRAWERAA